jgi:hypothetical protein
MRKLIALPVAGIFLIAMVGPVAAADPCVLGADAQECSSPVQAEGSSGTDFDGSGVTVTSTVTDQISTGTSALTGATDDLIELHKAKGAPTGAPDRL